MRLMTKRPNACFVSLSFAGLVVLARSLNPIPSRTRPLNSSAPMVLWLKPWESRSLPGLPRTKNFLFTCHDQTKRRLLREAAFFCLRAGWREAARLGLTQWSGSTVFEEHVDLRYPVNRDSISLLDREGM